MAIWVSRAETVPVPCNGGQMSPVNALLLLLLLLLLTCNQRFHETL